MRRPELQTAIITHIKQMKSSGLEVILVHGGGPFIQEILDQVGLESTFVAGHRYTSAAMMPYVEMALKGKVNGRLVGECQRQGMQAIGLSGKDGNSVIATKRHHIAKNGDIHDLGQVGDVAQVNTDLIELLLKHGYLPIFTCIASDTNGLDYNINADMFAGHLAAALQVDSYVVLTDVDGLMQDIKKPESMINELKLQDIEPLKGEIIQGGMIPKIDSCVIALENGAGSARILNGTKPEQLSDLFVHQKPLGTLIKKQ
ncbi:MAG: acetylglutamate kinase [Bernardetiaceae bacterium]|nr:acetylglutamate kinase [Bernardetiaceae bacterium]